MIVLDTELDVQMELGECPLWDHRHSRLYWVDIVKCTLYSMDWTSGSVSTWPLPALGGGLGLLGAADLIVAVQTGLFRFSPATGQYEFLLHPSPGHPTHRLNEGKTDRFGNYWIGTISTLGRLPECGLFRVTPVGAVHQAIAGIRVPNALVFLDNDRLTFADSADRLVWTYQLGEDGQLSDREILIDDTAHESIPDGAAMDEAGCIWNAKFGGGRIGVYDSKGAAIKDIPLPVTQVTSCSFCGPQLDYLAVTTGKRLLSDTQRRAQRQSGNLFLFRTSSRGIAEPVCPGIRSRSD